MLAVRGGACMHWVVRGVEAHGGAAEAEAEAHTYMRGGWGRLGWWQEPGASQSLRLACASPINTHHLSRTPPYLEEENACAGRPVCLAHRPQHARTGGRGGKSEMRGGGLHPFPSPRVEPSIF